MLGGDRMHISHSHCPEIVNIAGSQRRITSQLIRFRYQLFLHRGRLWRPTPSLLPACVRQAPHNTPLNLWRLFPVNIEALGLEVHFASIPTRYLYFLIAEEIEN